MLNEMLARVYVAMSSLVRDEEGASAVEYGLILGLIAVAIVAVLLLMKPELVNLFTGAKDSLVDANAP